MVPSDGYKRLSSVIVSDNEAFNMSHFMTTLVYCEPNIARGLLVIS